jgi:mannitol-1-phosphate 5-dehydrogenase
MHPQALALVALALRVPQINRTLTAQGYARTMAEQPIDDPVRKPPDHIHIGAGSFGLGMVVEVCNRGGLETAVLNRQSDRDHHRLLRELGRYQVVFDDSRQNRITVSPRIHYYDRDDDSVAINLLASPSVKLITTSVKKDNLPKVAPLLLHGLEKRAAIGSNAPLCILACENSLRNSAELKKYVEQPVSGKDRKHLFKGVFFCSTLVDRVCANISCSSNEVEVPVESFHGWIVNDPGYSVPVLDSLQSNNLIKLANNLEFDGHEVQKYWCMNGVHLAAAAYAYNHDSNLTHFRNALAVPEIRKKVLALQEELAAAFEVYVGRKGLQDWFSEKMIERFNKNIFKRLANNRTDTIARVLKQQGTPEVGALEILDRIERLLAPQCEILAYRKHLVHPKYETVALHAASQEMERLELDDAITQVVFALRNFTAEYVRGC